VFSALDATTRPIFFGPRAEAGRALFGWFHPARGGREPRRAVVLCPPLGYEAICAYPALRTFAERLAAAGFPVLRFDYDGAGDSAGSDADPDRVRAWVDSIGAAIDEARALSGADEVCLLGVRMGATLALLAATERGDVDRLVLWNACPSGKAYVRELKAFRRLAEQNGELTARPRPEGDASEESGGFLLAAETMARLGEINLLKLTERPAAKVLVIARDDVPSDDKLAHALEALGSSTSHRPMAGFGEMMVAPHRSVFPEAIGAAVIDWLGEAQEKAPRAFDGRRAALPSTARERGLVAPGVHEEAIRFGDAGGFFGVLTEPAGGAPRERPLFVFSNTAGNYRVGPNRMYVAMARRLAERGFASVRIDVSGIGDSAIWDDGAQNHPYADRLVTDVRAAIDHLRARGKAERFGVVGLCSGAFVAYHAALADPAVTSIVLVNLQIFEWKDGMSLEVNPLTRRDRSEYYKRRLFTKEIWLKMLRGEVDLPRALEDAFGSVVDRARGKLARLVARLPGAAGRGAPVARAFDELCRRGVDVLLVFSEGDPGIDNLNEKVGASLRDLLRRPSFRIATIDGADHSFTPLWAQAELDEVILSHVDRRIG
jgi:alpha-beta hydrolase superfamily lysophospholipase